MIISNKEVNMYYKRRNKYKNSRLTKKEWKKYKIAKAGGKIIRNSFNPNYINSGIKEVDLIGNYVLKKKTKGILNKLSYKSTALTGYKSGDNPCKGSLRYTLFNIFWKIVLVFIVSGCIFMIINMTKIFQ